MEIIDSTDVNERKPLNEQTFGTKKKHDKKAEWFISMKNECQGIKGPDAAIYLESSRDPWLLVVEVQFLLYLATLTRDKNMWMDDEK